MRPRRRWSLFSTRRASDLSGTIWAREGEAVYCRACGRRFNRWFGLANHGLAHVKRGDAETEVIGGRNLFYLSGTIPAPSHANDTGTEHEAAEKIRPIVGEIRRQVIGFIVAAGRRGLTPGEAVEAVNADRADRGLEPKVEHAIRPRLTELASPQFGGLIVETRHRRENGRGNREKVFKAHEFYIEADDGYPEEVKKP